MPNRTPAQANGHVNVQSFPVNIEAALRAQATRTVAFLVKHRARAYAKHPMMLDDFSRSCGCRPRDPDCHGEAADRNGNAGAAPVVRFWRRSPNPQRQGGLAFCACPAPGGENPSLARGGQPMSAACSWIIPKEAGTIE